MSSTPIQGKNLSLLLLDDPLNTHGMQMIEKDKITEDTKAFFSQLQEASRHLMMILDSADHKHLFDLKHTKHGIALNLNAFAIANGMEALISRKV